MTVSPSSLNSSGTNTTGVTGDRNQQADLGTLNGTALDNSVISGIKKVFNDSPELTDFSFYVNSLVDIYSKYPQIDKTKYLDLYSNATNNLLSYSPDFVESIKTKLSSQIS